MPNFGDPLWGESDFGGDSSAPFTFPPADPDEERGRIDIDQVRAAVKSGGKSVLASQFVTTINPGPDGGGGMWQGRDWVYSGTAAPTSATHAEVLTDTAGNPITVNGEWIYVTGIPD